MIAHVNLVHDVICCEEHWSTLNIEQLSLVHFDPPIITVEQLLLVCQIVGCPVILL